MPAIAVVQLLASLAAVALAAALVASDSGQRANRLVAIVLVCSAHWSVCEVLMSLSDDPQSVLQLARSSSLGWLWLGPLTLHIVSELVGGAHPGLRRLLPWAYACAAASISLYWLSRRRASTSPYAAASVWRCVPGPLFPLVVPPDRRDRRLRDRAVAPALPEDGVAGRAAAGPLAARRYRASRSRSRRRPTCCCPICTSTSPRLGSVSVLALGAIVAGSVRRHGYFLLAPGAFAREILETLRDGVALLHPDGEVRTSNEAFARLVGGAPAELAGASVFAVAARPRARRGDRIPRARARARAARRAGDARVRLVHGAARRAGRRDRARARAARSARGDGAAQPARHVGPARRRG